MLCFVPLLVFLAPPCSPSPVVYVINNGGFYPPAHITSGIIASENYIITPNYPLAHVVVPHVCVLPATNLLKVTKTHVRNFCKNIKKVISLYEISLLELTQPLIFTYKVNVAAIPAVKTLDSPLDCHLVVNKRKSNVVVSHGLLPVKWSNSSVKIDNGPDFCGVDTGLPLYCQDAVVGVMVLTQVKDLCCPTLCLPLEEVRILGLHGTQMQDLLREKIGIFDQS